jgi:hypothetical protein
VPSPGRRTGAASAGVIFGNRTGNERGRQSPRGAPVRDSAALSEIREKMFANKIGSGRLRDALDLLRDLGEVTLTVERTAGRPALRFHRVAPTEAAARNFPTQRQKRLRLPPGRGYR